MVKSNTSVQDPGKVIFNFSKYELSDCKKRLLSKGLHFSLPPEYLEYADYLVSFELFYTNIRNNGTLSNEDLHFINTRAKETDLFSCQNSNSNVPQHLSKDEFLALQNLRKNKESLSKNLITVILS